jgi:hypothetical protein
MSSSYKLLEICLFCYNRTGVLTFFFQKVVKNRFDGELGTMTLKFNKETLTYDSGPHLSAKNLESSRPPPKQSKGAKVVEKSEPLELVPMLEPVSVSDPLSVSEQVE